MGGSRGRGAEAGSYLTVGVRKASWRVPAPRASGVRGQASAMVRARTVLGAVGNGAEFGV